MLTLNLPETLVLHWVVPVLYASPDAPWLGADCHCQEAPTPVLPIEIPLPCILSQDCSFQVSNT